MTSAALIHHYTEVMNEKCQCWEWELGSERKRLLRRLTDKSLEAVFFWGGISVLLERMQINAFSFCELQFLFCSLN